MIHYREVNSSPLINDRSTGSGRIRSEEPMATMIPENVEQFTTEGERQTYRFLEAVAKPDNRFICWYLPDLQGREPDFLIFSGQNGLVVLEVKDWNLEQIREATPHRFLIDIGGKAESRQNPLKQARDYVSAMLDKVKADGIPKGMGVDK